VFCQSLDLASRRRERVLDRTQHVLVAPIIGRLVADDDVLVRRNRHPNVDAIGGAMAVLRPSITVAFLLLSARAERPPGELYARATMR
jgi:hypothetical protein